MKLWQFLTSLGFGLACLVMVVLLVLKIQANQDLQLTLQAQQESINKGSMGQQIGQNILKDLAQLSLEDSEIKDLLTKHGITVNVNSTPSSTP